MQKSLDQATRKAINLFFILFLVIGSLIAGSAALLYRTELNTFLSKMKTQERNALSRQNDAIKETFDAIVGDLIFLSRQNELLKYMASEDEITRRGIQREYIEMALAKNIYDQIRYVDAGGKERVRVNFENGKPRAVPVKELQSKAKRYYFTDTIALERDEIFVSPLDLNVEQGKVEQPFKPMIRFGTPVFDNNGVKRGIMLLNYLAKNLLGFIEKKQAGQQFSVNFRHLDFKGRQAFFKIGLSQSFTTKTIKILT